MASMPKTATSCEVNEEEYEDYEEVEMVEDVEGEDYEEAFEEEEEEIEQNEEEEGVEQNKEKEEEKEQNNEELEGIEQNEEEEEEIEQNEEEEEEEEAIEQKEEEEEEIKQDKKEEIERNEEEGEDDKKAVKVLKVQEEGQSVEYLVRKEEKSANPEEPSESEGKELPPSMAFPSFLQSVSGLEKLHCALSKFLFQWNSLNQSLDSIGAAIDAHAPPQHDVRSTEQEKDEISEQEKEKDHRSEQDKVKDERSEQEKVKDKRSWVEILCGQMQGKALRKYIESNFSDIDRLRHEVPEALRRLPDPEKLVFKAIGKFYTQGRRAYNSSPPLVSARRARILLLEFFVLSGRPTVVDSSVKQEAKLGALCWLKRLVNENIESATAVDSLGLILFLACFGIPKEFDSKDLWLLLLKSNLKKKIDVFLRSSNLVERIPGVIKDLIREEMYFEAAELSCYFGLTDTFSPLPLLSSCVAKVLQTGKLERQKSRGLPKSMNEANIRELKLLRSVVQCLKDHKFVVRDLASINLTKRISKLEKIVEGNEKRLKNKNLKRKAEHLKADKTSESQSKESVPSTSEASQRAPSHKIQDKPEPGFPSQPPFPDSKVGNYTLSAEVSNTRDYPYRWERKYHDSATDYRSFAMEYPSAQHFCQPQAPVYGNCAGITGRNLYQFADTVIQQEAQLAKSNRSSNTSPSGVKFGHY